jgi:DNA-binding NtrC family response regulator
MANDDRRRWSDELRFRPGQMPSLFGDTAATLIVDDDRLLAEVMSTVLADEGYVCEIATTSAEARERLAARDYALAFVDVMMPGQSGLELVSNAVRAHPDLAVVMVTGVDDPQIAELALDSGAYGYLIKPVQPNQLLITAANAGRRRCLEIERRVYADRLERRLEEQAADLEDALLRLKDKEAGD